MPGVRSKRGPVHHRTNARRNHQKGRAGSRPPRPGHTRSPSPFPSLGPESNSGRTPTAPMYGRSCRWNCRRTRAHFASARSSGSQAATAGQGLHKNCPGLSETRSTKTPKAARGEVHREEIPPPRIGATIRATLRSIGAARRTTFPIPRPTRRIRLPRKKNIFRTSLIIVCVANADHRHHRLVRRNLRIEGM